MYKTVFIEIFDLRPVLKFFKPLLASPGYNSRSKGNCRQRLRKILERGRGGANKVYQRRWQMNNFMSQEAYQNIHVVNSSGMVGKPFVIGFC